MDDEKKLLASLSEEEVIDYIESLEVEIEQEREKQDYE